MTGTESTRDQLARPVSDGGWVRPSGRRPAEPRWGFAEGIQIGLAPLPGPRGLIRVFTPYLGHADDRLLNFFALEPIPLGETARGYSELEHSRLDDVQGKRFWSTNELGDGLAPQSSTDPAGGVVETVDGTVDGVEQLSVFIQSERFDNGAHVAVRVVFRSDRPHELAVETYRHDDSVPLQALVVSATMGNFPRLRHLRLADRTTSPEQLWPGFAGDHFAPHHSFPLHELERTPSGAALFTAWPDEEDPAATEYDSSVAEHWHYVGVPAVQTWRAENPSDELVGGVNARRVYWSSFAPIPGGAAFENVELIEPFRDGRSFVFQVEPR
jgi:hypothetical protein